MDLLGMHHVTAVSAAISANYRFYTQVIGQRLVKRTVNQDDVRAYHLFYADAVGSPGTDLTFFDWPVPAEQRGTHSIARTTLRVSGQAALAWWVERLNAHAVPNSGIIEQDQRMLVEFTDPEGQRLALIDDGGLGDPPTPWEQSPVPVEYQVRGLGPVSLSVPQLAPTATILTQALNMRLLREYARPEAETVAVYAMGAGGPAAELHVMVQPQLPAAQPGAGGVHHVAFRTPNESEYDAWVARLTALRIPNSGPVDRYYFRSLYFREPNGILFEIATDGPGFGVDEDSATLGEKVILPPKLEPRRAAILANLKPIEA
jgi:glyoxalase family protein